VGVLIAAITTTQVHVEPAGLPPTPFVDSARAALLAPTVSNHRREAERSKPKRISGFAVLAEAPAAERVPYRGTTITDMISIARPLSVAEQPDEMTEPLKVTLPVRKPQIKIRAKPKRNPVKPKHRLTLWDQLPWLRAR
jgi:hypothetical protein